MAMGESTYVASGYISWGGTPYYNGDGTSFATPVLAGAVACLRQARPNASVQEICDAVRQSGDRASNPDSKYGYGIPDFSKAIEMLKVDESSVTKEELISVYPNPSHGSVSVALNCGEQADLAVYDMMGRCLYNCICNELGNSVLENYLSGLEPGIYFVSVISGSESQTVKLVLMR